jgi:diguanylate cyclase (GGDEF)-like protein/PAS domain S-box-containing protein
MFLRFYSLRVRTRIIVGLTSFILFCGQYALARFILLRSFTRFEAEQAIVNTEKVHSTLKAKVKEFDRLLGDWAPWDDAYAFMQNRNDNFVRSNMSASGFTENEIDTLILTDTTGRQVVAKGFNLVEQKPRPVYPPILPLASGQGALLQHKTIDSKMAGILVLPKKLVFVASRPILQSNYEGPMRGTMIMGRCIEAAEIQQIDKTLGVVVSLHHRNAPTLPLEMQNAIQQLSPQRPIFLQAQNEDVMVSYSVVQDIFNEPALILRTEMNRQIYQQGLASLTYYFWSTFSLVLIFGVLSLLLLERSQNKLQQSEEQYALAAQGANDGLWDWNIRTNEIYFSPRWKSILGLQADDLGNQLDAWLQRIHPEDRERFQSELFEHLQGKTPYFENEYRILNQERCYCWVLCRGLAVRDVAGKAYRMAGSQTDLTSRRVLYDQLTGLSNRTLFRDQLERALKRSKRQSDYLFAVIFLDCDRFKVVNDSLGHLLGDQLLIETAQRLQACMRPGDVVARLGGDEFAVLLENIREIEDATVIATRINQELSRPFNLTGHTAYISASIGIAWNSGDCQQPDDLLRNADTAMYRAKAQGKARYEVFDAEMNIQAKARLELETELRKALGNHEFVLYYQPIISLSTTSLIGFEALLRWRHPHRGMISPETFIPVAEETGLIVPMGSWVLQEACHQMTLWQQHYLAGRAWTMSVNLSRKQFSQPDLVEQITQTLQQTELSASNLKLEVTETALMDQPEEIATQILLALKHLGIQLSIDDFGTGYSSLSCLNAFPIDMLKIDRSFIQQMDNNQKYSEVVNTINTLAHTLGLKVIAEGVETEQQISKLKMMKCNYAQGYYFAKPQVAQNLEQWLSQQTATGYTLFCTHPENQNQPSLPSL